jgi:hypothetical protein
MGQDFWRNEREAEAKAKPEPEPQRRPKPETALESDWRGHSWERYMDELRRKYASVSDD